MILSRHQSIPICISSSQPVVHARRRTEADDALIRAADQCAVKKHLDHPPVFEVKTVVK